MKSEIATVSFLKDVFEGNAIGVRQNIPVISIKHFCEFMFYLKDNHLATEDGIDFITKMARFTNSHLRQFPGFVLRQNYIDFTDHLFIVLHVCFRKCYKNIDIACSRESFERYFSACISYHLYRSFTNANIPLSDYSNIEDTESCKLFLGRM